MKLFLAALALWGASSFAATTTGNDITCDGWVYNNGTDKFDQVTLTQASYDKNFLEGNVRTYGLGVDKFFLASSNSLTLVIVDNKTKAASSATAGWKKIDKTLMQDVNLFVNLPDGSRDQVQVTCYKYL